MRILVTIPAKPRRVIGQYTGPLSQPRTVYDNEPGVEWGLEDLEVPRLPPNYGVTAPIPTTPYDLLALGSSALRRLADQLSAYASAAAAMESGQATARDGSVLALLLERLEKEGSSPQQTPDVQLDPAFLAALADDE